MVPAGRRSWISRPCPAGSNDAESTRSTGSAARKVAKPFTLWLGANMQITAIVQERWQKFSAQMRCGRSSAC
jgi:hypothetical protein